MDELSSIQHVPWFLSALALTCASCSAPPEQDERRDDEPAVVLLEEDMRQGEPGDGEDMSSPSPDMSANADTPPPAPDMSGEDMSPPGGEHPCPPPATSPGEGDETDTPPGLDVWPNEVSRANSDPWLVANHHRVASLRPKVLVLNFANPASDEAARRLVDQVIAGFREGSRHHGWGDPAAAPQLKYEVARLVDLRDGVGGRPAPPADYPYENSTLTPRREPGEEGYWRWDYAQFFGESFAEHYGYEDPDAPGTYLTLCELIDRGVIHELWFIGSGDVPDVNAAEVLEHKQRWSAEGDKIEGSFDSCAGNGCFDPDVPTCSRSVRIGFINYSRGPGCYLHSQGHGLEGLGRSDALPTLNEWFERFAALDLDERYGLPFDSFYALGCDEPPCASFSPDGVATFNHQGRPLVVSDMDTVCGNVHFPPNGTRHYDYDNMAPALASCEGFGQHAVACGEDARTSITRSKWLEYEALSPDCGGAFLVWWFQNMPAHGSGQTFEDRRPMPSVWPFLFY